MKRIITIDGLASSGKSTIAKVFARKYGYACLDAGIIFRSIAYLLERGDIFQISDVFPLIKQKKLVYDKESTGELFLASDGIDCMTSLNSLETGQRASILASQKDSFLSLVEIVRLLAEQETRIVCAGKGVGTFIFPGAFCQFYTVADIKIRSIRRWQELRFRSLQISYSGVLEDLKKRDRQDTERDFCPLVIPSEAIVIFTDQYSIDECVYTIAKEVKKKEK